MPTFTFSIFQQPDDDDDQDIVWFQYADIDPTRNLIQQSLLSGYATKRMKIYSAVKMSFRKVLKCKNLDAGMRKCKWVVMVIGYNSPRLY